MTFKCITVSSVVRKGSCDQKLNCRAGRHEVVVMDLPKCCLRLIGCTDRPKPAPPRGGQHGLSLSSPPGECIGPRARRALGTQNENWTGQQHKISRVLVLFNAADYVLTWRHYPKLPGWAAHRCKSSTPRLGASASASVERLSPL